MTLPDFSKIFWLRRLVSYRANRGKPGRTNSHNRVRSSHNRFTTRMRRLAFIILLGLAAGATAVTASTVSAPLPLPCANCNCARVAALTFDHALTYI